MKRASLMVVLLAAAAFAQDQPYAGQDARALKSLSEKEVSDLLEGRGMGFAKPAELNHYPGPKHVLELKDELALSPEQQEKTQAVFGRMKDRAVSLGKQIVDRERGLDTLFASGRIDAAQLQELTSEIARLQGELRATHLQAHVEQRALLTPEQVQKYDRLRGYGDGHPHSGEHKH